MFAKVFASLYQGTLRGNAHGILVFTNLLAHSDKNGEVDIHPRAIADEVGLPEPAVRDALLYLEAVDPESRTPTEDGRRIVRMDAHRAWGWRIVNYAKYRAIRSEEDRREQNRVAQEKFRNKSKPPSAKQSQAKPKKAQAEADAEGEAEAERTTRAKALTVADLVGFGLTTETAVDFIALRRKKRAPLTARAWKGIAEEASKAGWTNEQACCKCLARGWQGFEADWVKGEKAGGVNKQEQLEARNRSVADAWAAGGGVQ